MEDSENSTDPQIAYYQPLIDKIKSESFEQCPVDKLYARDDAQFHIMGEVTENIENGERYLRVLVREWYRDKSINSEPGLNSTQLLASATGIENFLERHLRNKVAGKITKIEVWSLLFFRFDESDYTFDYQDELLYDITSDHLDTQ